MVVEGREDVIISPDLKTACMHPSVWCGAIIIMCKKKVGCWRELVRNSLRMDKVVECGLV